RTGPRGRSDADPAPRRMERHHRQQKRTPGDGLGAARPAAYRRIRHGRCGMNAAVRTSIVGGVAALLSALPLVVLTDGGGWLVQALVAIAVVVAAGHAARMLRIPMLLTAAIQVA